MKIFTSTMKLNIDEKWEYMDYVAVVEVIF